MLTPKIFDKLEQTQRGAGGEIQLTDAIAALMEEQEVFGYEFEGTRYDAGTTMGWLKASVEIALHAARPRDRVPRLPPGPPALSADDRRLVRYDAAHGRDGRTAPATQRGDDLAEIGQIAGRPLPPDRAAGQGGMATIYRATDTGLGRDVALKLLRPEYLRDPDFSSRFRQEAQAAASLSHPNVVTVYDYGEDPSGPYIVMELVDGEDLATILRRSGALPPRQVARIGAGVARALAAAHARGLVHRDIKPGNVLIGTRRPGQGRRLRDRPGDRRGPGDAARDDPRLGPLLQPGAGARRAGDGRLGHLQPRHRPVRDAHRRPAVGGRQRRVASPSPACPARSPIR